MENQYFFIKQEYTKRKKVSTLIPSFMYINLLSHKNNPTRRLLDSPLHIVRSVPKVFHTVLKIVVLFHGVAILYG